MSDSIPIATLLRISNLVLKGDKIEAITQYREATGMSLAQAHEAIGKLEAAVRNKNSAGILAAAREMVNQATAGAAVASPFTHDPDMWREITALLAKGGKIDAIKRYRELTGVGLKEAKDAVEQMSQTQSPAADAGNGFPSPAASGEKVTVTREQRMFSSPDRKEMKETLEPFLQSGTTPSRSQKSVVSERKGCGVNLLLASLVITGIWWWLA